jgi:hypothetical protein
MSGYSVPAAWTKGAIWEAIVSIKQMYHAQRRDAESTPSPIPTEVTYDEEFLNDPDFQRMMNGIARASQTPSESSDEPPPEGHLWQATEGELGNETLPPVLPLCACDNPESPVVADFPANMDQRGDPAPAGTKFIRLVLKRPEVQQQPQQHQQQECHVVVDRLGVLGQGAHGKVYAGMLCGRTQVAVKVIRGTPKEAMKVEDEMRRANRSRHDNVVRFFGLVTFDDNVVGVVMELLGESLDKAIGCDPSTLMKYTLQIIAGMEHMHNRGRGVIHFDLKPANLLLTQDGSSVKIIDFSVSMTSTSLNNAVPSVRGTLPFIAPELFDKPPRLSMKCDLYSFAVVLAQLWTGTVPWGTKSPSHICPFVIAGNRPYSPQELRESGVPSPIIALIVACWAQEPEDRPTFTRLRELQTFENFHLAQPKAWPHFLSTRVV